MIFLLTSNPFVEAYQDSDLLGKLIFLSLIGLSILTWSILIHKLWITRKVKNSSMQFRKSFFEQQQLHDNPLEVLPPAKTDKECPNAFSILYEVLKSKTQEILSKNEKVARSKNEAYLSASDVALLDATSQSTISTLTKYLEKNLYLLSTVVTLAPFLGLLGTVYGILVTFAGMKSGDPSGASNQVVLGGLSLALTTTVMGLVDAIPALIGYNYLKNIVHDFDSEMDRFSNDVLSSIELHYRR